MSPPLAMYADGRKFMWDGRVCATTEEAASAKARYEGNRFEVRVVEGEGGFLVYTRRAAIGTGVTVQ